MIETERMYFAWREGRDRGGSASSVAFLERRSEMLLEKKRSRPPAAGPRLRKFPLLWSRRDGDTHAPMESRGIPSALLPVLALVGLNGCLGEDGALFAEPPARPQMEAPVSPMPAAASAEPPGTPAGASPEQMFVGELEPAMPATPPMEMLAPPAPAAEAEADPCALEGLLVCDGFEDQAVGAFPVGPGWLPELAGCGTHTIDESIVTASGTRALRADAGGYPECMLHANATGEVDLHVRTRVLLGPTDGAADQYTTLLEFGASATADDPEIRIGLRPPDDSLCPDAPGLDVTAGALVGGPRTTCTGVSIEPERWYCIESHLERQGQDLELSVSIDGSVVYEQTLTGGDAWDGDALFVKLGRAAYGENGPRSIWHDDVAVGRLPIPCGP